MCFKGPRELHKNKCEHHFLKKQYEANRLALNHISVKLFGIYLRPCF